MLTYKQTFSSFSADDISHVKRFYEQKLGLDVTEEEMGILTLHFADGAQVVIYPKGKNHQPASFTVLNFMVENIEETVDQLIQSGVHFEEYDGELQTDEKGIFRREGPLIAWFKDPAGNILSVVESSKNNSVQK